MEIVCNKFISSVRVIAMKAANVNEIWLESGETVQRGKQHNCITNKNSRNSKLQICKKCRNIKKKTNKTKRSYVDDGCEQGIFQLKYQEPNKIWSTHL